MQMGMFFHKELSEKNWPVVDNKYTSFEKIIDRLTKDPQIAVIEPEPVSDELLLKVHSKEFLEVQKRACYGAKLTVGGVIKACEMVWKGELRKSWSF